MTPEERKVYMQKYNQRPENKEKQKERLKKLHKRKYLRQQKKRYELGHREYARTPDFSKESLCRKCGTIWPKCYRCPNCHVTVKNVSKFRNKENVFRH